MVAPEVAGFFLAFVTCFIMGGGFEFFARWLDDRDTQMWLRVATATSCVIGVLMAALAVMALLLP